MEVKRMGTNCYGNRNWAWIIIILIIVIFGIGNNNSLFNTNDNCGCDCNCGCKDKPVATLNEAVKRAAGKGGAKIVMPKWVEFNTETFVGKILDLPKREDIDLSINEQLIVELYSK